MTPTIKVFSVKRAILGVGLFFLFLTIVTEPPSRVLIMSNPREDYFTWKRHGDIEGMIIRERSRAEVLTGPAIVEPDFSGQYMKWLASISEACCSTCLSLDELLASLTYIFSDWLLNRPVIKQTGFLTDLIFTRWVILQTYVIEDWLFKRSLA